MFLFSFVTYLALIEYEVIFRFKVNVQYLSISHLYAVFILPFNYKI